MGFIKTEDVLGYYDNQKQAYCLGCSKDLELDSEAGPEDILYRKDVENADGIYFCDKCGDRIE